MKPPFTKPLAAELAAALSLVCATALIGWFKIGDPDFFWHLKVGQLILERGGLIETNTLSALFPDRAWHNPEWLFQTILAVVFAAGGWLGIAVFKAVVVSASALTLYAAARWQGAGRVAALALALLVFAATRFRLTERPQLLSYLFFALTIFLVERYRRGGRASIVWSISALFVVWSNFHPQLIFGLVYLYAVSLGDLLLGRWERSGASTRGKGLLSLALTATGAALVNPGGYRVLTYGWEHRHYHRVLVISEFNDAPLAAHPVFYGLAAALVIVAMLLRKKADLPLLATAALFFAVAVVYQRNIPEFTMIAALYLARALAGAATAVGAAATTGSIVALALASTAWCLAWDHKYPYSFGYGPLERIQPAAAADFLGREDLPKNLYNDFRVGGYLALRLFPRHRVFQDGRIPAYPLDFLAAVNPGRGWADWPGLLSGYGVNTALVELPLLKQRFAEAAWAVVYWDDRFAVVVRRDAVDRSLLDRLEYRYFKPLDAPESALSAGSFERLKHELSRNLRERQGLGALDAAPATAAPAPAPDQPREAALSGDFARGNRLVSAGRREEAVDAYREAISADRGNYEAWHNLGCVLGELGRLDEASAAFEQTLRLKPDHPTARANLGLIRGARSR